MDQINKNKCVCGKSKSSMNSMNWNRHIKACKFKNFKKVAEGTQDIKSFFSSQLSEYLLQYMKNYWVFFTFNKFQNVQKYYGD